MRHSTIIFVVVFACFVLIPVVVIAQTDVATATAISPWFTMAGALIGSLASGKGFKHKTKLDNDAIPLANNIVWGGGAGGAVATTTGDPMHMLYGLGGSIAANLTHKLFRWIF